MNKHRKNLSTYRFQLVVNYRLAHPYFIGCVRYSKFADIIHVKDYLLPVAQDNL